MHATKVEKNLLTLSLIGAVFFAILGIAWGIYADSGMMIFDGLYSIISVALSGISMLVLQEVQKGDDDTFPFGRYSLEPALILARSLILIGLFAYSGIDALSLLVNQGRETEIASASIYAVISTAGCLLVYTILLKGKKRHPSGLLNAECNQWLGDTLLSTGVLVGFTIALVMEQTRYAPWVIYVDPLMVVIAVLCFLRFPLVSMHQAIKQLLSISPPPEVVAEIQTATEQVLATTENHEFKIHVSQNGRMYDVEVNIMANPDDIFTVKEMDVLRMSLHELLMQKRRDAWINLNITAKDDWL